MKTSINHDFSLSYTPGIPTSIASIHQGLRDGS